jgi:hypothetical protein
MWELNMRKLLSILTILSISVGFNFINGKPAHAIDVVEIERSLDFNNDGKVNGYDWLNMSFSQKQELIFLYYTSSFKSTVINMSNSTREREISRLISQLNYYYMGVNSQNKIVKVGEIFQLLID